MWCERQLTVYVYARLKPGSRVTEATFLMVSSLQTYATKLAALTHVRRQRDLTGEYCVWKNGEWIKRGYMPLSPPQYPLPVELLVWIWTKIYTLIFVDEIYALPIWTQHMRQFTGWLIISSFHTLKPRQDGRLFPDDILEWIFLSENLWISNTVSFDFIPWDSINNIPALFPIMAGTVQATSHYLSEPWRTCVTRPQWANLHLSGPSHYQNKWWLIVNWRLRDKFRWNWKHNAKLSAKKLNLKLSSGKFRQTCADVDVLTESNGISAYIAM